MSGFTQTAGGIAGLEPENITVHTLAIKRASRINLDGTAPFCAHNSEVEEMLSYSQRIFTECGYEPYYIYRQKNTVSNQENTGYSKPGKIGLYNIYMMEEFHSVFSAGAGGVTKLVNQETGYIARINNPKFPYEYLCGKSDPATGIKEFYENISTQ